MTTPPNHQADVTVRPEGASSPFSPASCPPVKADGFSSTEDYLLAVVRYATNDVQPQSESEETRGCPPEAPAAGRLIAEPLESLAPVPADEELESLRRLVLGREIDGLENVHRQLSDRRLLAEAISEVAAEAIRLRARKDDQLVVALKATVDKIVRNSVRNNPSELADNLFPVMGPAIRRSISESIKSMLQDFSRALEKGFSLTGLKWRIEAARTGRKFSEVVMIKTIEYQVEQVMFIHSDTGLPLIHLYREDAPHKDDGDQVSAMLTAIKDFTRDSFAEGELSTVEFGGFNIHIAQAPQAYLACVVRGQAPSDLRIDIQIALERIVMECADELDAYKRGGSPEPFKKAAHYAAALLARRYKDEDKKLPFTAVFVPVMLLLAMLAGLGFWGYSKYRTAELEKMVHSAVNEKIGIIPLRVKPSVFGVWEISILQDELADKLAYQSSEPLSRRLIQGGLPADRFVIHAWPFVSREIEIVMERVYAILEDAPAGINRRPDIMRLGSRQAPLEGTAPISWALAAYERLSAVPGIEDVKVNVSDPGGGVTLSIEQGRLRLEGRAALIPWIFHIYEKIINTAGITDIQVDVRDRDNGVIASVDGDVLKFHGQASLGWKTALTENAAIFSVGRLVDISGIEDDEATRQFKALRDQINRVVIHFPSGKDTPAPEDAAKLDQAIDDLVKLERLAESLGTSIALTIYGHADATGSDTRNYELSQSRTKAVAAKLYARGSLIPISSYGLGAEFASRSDGAGRPANSQSSRKIELRVDIDKKPPAFGM